MDKLSQIAKALEQFVPLGGHKWSYGALSCKVEAIEHIQRALKRNRALVDEAVKTMLLSDHQLVVEAFSEALVSVKSKRARLAFSLIETTSQLGGQKNEEIIERLQQELLGFVNDSVFVDYLLRQVVNGTRSAYYVAQALYQSSLASTQEKIEGIFDSIDEKETFISSRKRDLWALPYAFDWSRPAGPKVFRRLLGSQSKSRHLSLESTMIRSLQHTDKKTANELLAEFSSDWNLAHAWDLQFAWAQAMITQMDDSAEKKVREHLAQSLWQSAWAIASSRSRNIFMRILKAWFWHSHHKSTLWNLRVRSALALQKIDPELSKSVLRKATANGNEDKRLCSEFAYGTAVEHLRGAV